MSKTKVQFSDIVGVKPIVTSGSIEIELQSRGYKDFPVEVYNLKSPVIVEHIYRDFLIAGATLLLTNTFHANRITLEQAGLSDKVYEINRKAVWIARKVALQNAYVAGVIGPTGIFFVPIGTLTEDEALQVFIEQAVALIDGGAELIMLKSFIDINELEIAIKAVRSVHNDIPIIALKTFPEDGSVLATSYPSDIAYRLKKYGVLAIGSSGTVGPQRMCDIIRALSVTSIPLCALPEIAIPTLVDGRAVYNAEVDYVASVAVSLVQGGACIIGADGGASVQHIKAISDAVTNQIPGSSKYIPKLIKEVNTLAIDSDKVSSFSEKIGKKFLTTVEVEIPRGLDISNVINAASYLKEQGIDAINVFDGARARVRINPIAASYMISSATGMECITHIACRDRNMVGLQSDLIGAYALGVKNILAVTGDPTSIGDYPFATSVYDVDSIGLIRAVNRMNHGMDLMGNPLGRSTRFLITCAANPAADDIEREIKRLEKKAQEGATMYFTQPIFDIKTLEYFLDATKHLSMQCILGIIPLRSIKHAEFLHYEVPGMVVPDWVRKKLKDVNTDSGIEGMNIAIEFLKQAKGLVQGVYIMPPAKKYDMAINILHAADIL